MNRLACLLLFSLVACGTTTPPEWYFQPPTDDGYRYGAGRFSSEKRRTARHQAIQDAAYMIATQKGVQVISISESEETEKGVTAIIRTTQGVDQTVSGFEIVKVLEGRVEDRPHLWECFALLKIDEKRLLGF